MDAPQQETKCKKELAKFLLSISGSEELFSQFHLGRFPRRSLTLGKPATLLSRSTYKELRTLTTASNELRHLANSHVGFQLLCKGLVKITPPNMMTVSEIHPIREFIRRPGLPMERPSKKKYTDWGFNTTMESFGRVVIPEDIRRSCSATWPPLEGGADHFQAFSPESSLSFLGITPRTPVPHLHSGCFSPSPGYSSQLLHLDGAG
ncbi:Leucine-rich repeat-containing G-protein coupled receptor 4 [Manis javanica]|nr:Leucine-rich repeat-containing G-protein coupled receptor 4 [Manis javanica]